LEPLNFYNRDLLRQESEEEQKNIQDEIVKTYTELEYEVIMVPFMSVSKRVEFIIGSLSS
jgi:predicted ATPase